MITKIKLLACSAFRRVIIRLVRRKLAFFKVLQFYNACFDIQDISCYKVFADEELLSEKGLIGYSRNILQYVKEPSEAEAFLGRGFNASTEKTFRLAMKFKKPMFLAEDGFVRSLYPASATADLEYKEARSMTFDSKAFYFVGGCSSNLEDMLARSSLSREQISEARRLISLILDHNISKYRGVL